MGETGRDLLRERIKNKRASDGLRDIPLEDLFVKKPKYDLSSEEKQRLLERRKRNKEAAEKSRKKKKDEFEKLQSENDQLCQDKCEMAAMIEKLKGDNRTLSKELTALKCWIGKRADQLGLVKYQQKNAQTTENNCGRNSSGNSVLRGDPSLHSAGSELPSKSVVRSKSPASSEGSCSPPPVSMEHFKPVGVRTSISNQLQTPWLVEQQVLKKENEVIVSAAQQVPHSMRQVIQMAEGQHVVYLPKDSFIIVQDGQQDHTETVEFQQATLMDPQSQQLTVKMAEAESAEMSGITSGSLSSGRGDVIRSEVVVSNAKTDSDIKKSNFTAESTAAFDPSVVTAIESLLRLGYKIQSPGSTQEENHVAAAASQEMNVVIPDRGYEAPNMMTVPQNVPESTGATITQRGSRMAVVSENKLTPLAGHFQMDFINKLRECGLIVHTVPSLAIA